MLHLFTKIICLFWLLFVLVVSTAYKSKLVSVLAFPVADSLPFSFESLAKSSYFIVLQYTGAAFLLFKTSKHPTYVKIFDTMEIENNDVKCFEKALHSKTGCVSWVNIVNYVVQRNLSDQYGHAPLVKAPAATYFVVAAIPLSKRSIYRMEFNKYINLVRDSGIMEKLKRIDDVFVTEERKLWIGMENLEMPYYSNEFHR